MTDILNLLRQFSRYSAYTDLELIRYLTPSIKFNQYKKQGLCVHCQSKNRLVLLKPHVKRSKAYSFLLFVLRKIGCYS